MLYNRNNVFFFTYSMFSCFFIAVRLIAVNLPPIKANFSSCFFTLKELKELNSQWLNILQVKADQLTGFLVY